MVDVICPNCNKVLEVSNPKEMIVCKECLANTGKKFIMVESDHSPKYNNLGDGLFEQVK